MSSQIIEIEIPEGFEKITNLQGDELSKQFQLALAILLFKQEKISIGKAAELAGMYRREFEHKLAENGIEAYDLDPQQVNEDVAKLHKIL